MAKLAIKGHETRGSEVIEILRALGGLNAFNYAGMIKDEFYFIGKSGMICKGSIQHNHIVFALEEFLEKFPYKVGDKVLAYCEGTFAQSTIQGIQWNYELNRVEYKICSSWCDTSLIQPYQEELITMEERKCAELRIDVDQDDKLATEATIDGGKITPPKNYLIGKITKVDNGMLVEFVKKQNQYPETYAECCDVLSIAEYYNLRYYTYVHGYNEYATTDKLCSLQDKLNILGKLIICRDAYWKIAGEQMGLEKPWEPDWLNTEQDKFVLYTHDNVIYSNSFVLGHNVLAFPTAEMRDAFYENFKDLIENCKELL